MQHHAIWLALRVCESVTDYNSSFTLVEAECKPFLTRASAVSGADASYIPPDAELGPLRPQKGKTPAVKDLAAAF